jgi:predicted dehydrogenase
MKTIGIGMLGAGFIGQMHSLAFGAVHRAKREPHLKARLIALADTDQALAETIRDRYEWETIAGDWRVVIEHPDVEVFINSGPNDAHAAPTIAAAALGKQLFSEKPLARKADEAYTMWAAAERPGVKHMCAFVHRFVPALQMMRSMIAAGEIGRIRHFRSNFLINMQHCAGRWSG